MYFRKLLAVACVVGLAGSGCHNEADRPGRWRTDWLGTARWDGGAVSTQPVARDVYGSVFDVWILETPAESEGFERAWSQLGRPAPGEAGQWELFSRNGLRCGVGSVDNWPTVKAELERCGAKMKTQTQISTQLFMPMSLLNDAAREDRIVFYCDRSGRLRGRDFGRSKLHLSLTSAGRLGGGRVRVTFSPKIVKLARSWASRRPLAARSRQPKTVEQELEDMNITIDLGPDEFAMLGPASGELSELIIGSQLFLRWKQGQLFAGLVLIKPSGDREISSSDSK